MRSRARAERRRQLTPRAYLPMITFRAWLAEVPLAAVNAFVLMDRVYSPRLGALRAHQLGMSTRIALALAFAVVITSVARDRRLTSLLLAGAFWMTSWLVFEWAGSLLIGRPIREILVGWHVERGYMWPYVLITYLLAPLVVGTLLSRARRPRRTDPGPNGA